MLRVELPGAAACLCGFYWPKKCLSYSWLPSLREAGWFSHREGVCSGGGRQISQGEKRQLQKPWRHYNVQTGLSLYRWNKLCNWQRAKEFDKCDVHIKNKSEICCQARDGLVFLTVRSPITEVSLSGLSWASCCSETAHEEHGVDPKPHTHRPMVVIEEWLATDLLLDERPYRL